MTTRAEIVSAARLLIDTPYLHQGRKPGPNGGTDCIGVPVLTVRALGLKPQTWDITGYRRIPDGHSLMRHLREEMAAEVSQADMQPGDLAVFDWGRFPHHVGIIGDYELGGLSLIHADNRNKKVVEHRLVLTPPIRFVAAFRFPGVV
jgi:cell wall-associated NlpC family hydrolase